MVFIAAVPISSSFRTAWLVLYVLLGVFLITGCSRTPPASTSSSSRSHGEAPEDTLESVRDSLTKETDPEICHSVISQLNAHFEKGNQRPPKLTAKQQALLKERFGLDTAELVEADNTSFTLLDAHHLDLCFLLRDAMQSLDLDHLSPAERAGAGFAWVMRQVQLREVQPRKRDNELYPPAIVLRTGWGTAQERALVFLALLQQMSIPGALVSSGDGGDAWACGALVEVNVDKAKEKQIVLFDPRLGLPLPGVKGKQAATVELARAFRLAMPVPGPVDGQEIATLAGLRQQADSLRQLTVDEKHRYDITPEDARQSSVYLAYTVSALAPRMQYLQDQLLAPTIRVRLAVDPQAILEQWDSATGQGDSRGTPVRVWASAAGIQRRFFPAEEGGVDRNHRKMLAERDLIPFQVLPEPIRRLQGKPAEIILSRFAYPFLMFQMGPRLPRDQLLRGHWKEAARDVTVMLDELRTHETRLRSYPEVGKEFATWAKQAYEAYANLYQIEEEARRGKADPAALDAAKQRIEQVWRQGSITILMEGISAGPRSEQATRLLALCMQEQAERKQLQLDRNTHEEETKQQKVARDTWNDVVGWWESYLQNFGDSRYVPGARLLLARARAMIGEPQLAQAMLQDSVETLGEWDQVARLYMIHRLQAKP